jgi:response regulator RpfG family c-di-GMP phosphodiesterase
VFRDPLPAADALIELERCSGTQFDPLVVDAFRTLAARTE